MKWPQFRAAPGSIAALQHEARHNVVNDGPAPPEGRCIRRNEASSWPLNDGSQPPRRPQPALKAAVSAL